MPWQQLTAVAPAAEVPRLSERLERAGALSVTTSAADEEELFIAHANLGESAEALWSLCRLQALFDVAVDLATVTAELGADATVTSVDVARLEDQDWLSANQAPPMQFADGALTLAPRSARASGGPNTVYLDAGLAFGSGSHPTTRMCLEWIARTDLTGLRGVDFGCGSGVLALAMLARGADSVVAVDIDPQARVATEDNAHYNGVRAGALTVLAPEQFQANSTPADIVVANILANPLITLAPQLTAAVAVGGRLSLTGILSGQASSVIAAYPQVALAVCDERPADGASWVRLEGVRRAAAE